ncbi:MAG: hypothetical protein ACJA1U_000077 [Bermanella sp.]
MGSCDFKYIDHLQFYLSEKNKDMSTEELINNLLYEEESTTLDFKSEQYKFVKAQDRDKSELLKDILAFVNSWRRTDAYILIGVAEVKGGKSLIKGIDDDLDDAQLQQFVQSKINAPIHFSYQTIEQEGKKIGVITIPVQTRPIYLKKNFANLVANTVYVRRGSSTTIALPDEIAKMGSSDTKEIKKSPKLNTFIVSGEHDEKQLNCIEQTIILAKIPKGNDFPKYGDHEYPHLMSSSFFNKNNSKYYSEFSEYFRQMNSFFALRIGIKNDGNLVARDVKAYIDFQGLPKGSLIFHERDTPERPNTVSEISILRSLDYSNNLNRNYVLEIKEIPNGYRAIFNFGKLQPKDTKICLEHLCLKITDSCQPSVNVTIFSDDLESPDKSILKINVCTEEKEFSINQIMQLSE